MPNVQKFADLSIITTSLTSLTYHQSLVICGPNGQDAASMPEAFQAPEIARSRPHQDFINLYFTP